MRVAGFEAVFMYASVLESHSRKIANMRSAVVLVTGILSLCSISLCRAAEAGLVARYTFDEGTGWTARDQSGNKNDGRILGGAKWVKGTYGSALELNGKDAYVDCGTGSSLSSVAAAGTIQVWCHPDKVQGGLVNWSTGGGWNDERLVLAVNTYHGGNTMIGCIADGGSSQTFTGFGVVEEKEWVHLTFSWEGKTISVFRNGLLAATCALTLTPEIKGVPLWLGRCQGLGSEYFDGILDEVRIYNRALTTQEVFASYKKEAALRGKDARDFSSVRVAGHTYPGPGKIIATVDLRAMQPVPAGTTVEVALVTAGSQKPTQRQRVSEKLLAYPVEVTFDAEKLSTGDYLICASAIKRDGARLGNESHTRVRWEGQLPELRGVKVLNQLVWELLNVKAKGNEAIGKELSFNNPCDRWIYLQTSAKVGKGGKLFVTIDSQDRPAITHAESDPDTQEAMQYLRAGTHKLNVTGEGAARSTQVVVRSIPMLQHAFYDAHPHIAPYGSYDWEFLRKDVLPNVNTMVGGPGPELEAWKKSGRKWISIIGLPQMTRDDEAAVESAYQHWSSSPGFQNALMDGVIVDEFGGGDDPSYDVYRKAVERLYASPQFKGRMFIPYGGIFYREDRSRKFAKACMEGGGYVAWEQYLCEEPTEEAGRKILQNLAAEMQQWEKGLPGVARRMVLVYGLMSQPTESLNVNPSVNYRVWMDMQMRLLATHPVFFGLGGIQEYHSAYADEESVRWTGRLYRHYAIEGNTQPLTEDPYLNAHLQNPDFAEGTKGWRVSPTEPGSIQPKKHKGYSWLEGRYPPTPVGNTFLWMKRSGTKPNVFSQEIGKLTPGRLYSLKMITADYQDLVLEKSSKATNAVTIQLDNVELLPAPKNSFQFTFPNCYAHVVGRFNAQYPFWMNYHWRVFRAKGPTARLRVSDWQSDGSPGGPVGQELIYNFIEVQAYLEE
jgi:hypothetical protein